MIKIERYENSGESIAPSYGRAEISAAVSEIIADVRRRGDEALIDYALKFDGVRLKGLAVTEEEFAAAEREVEPGLKKIIAAAAENIRQFHKRQIREGFSVTREDGSVVGQRIIPIERAGLYVPGGTAAYPSTVLMSAIPAAIAGCKEIVMTTPPKKDGKIPAAILYAAHAAGVTKVFKSGGAQAIAALAFGTESVPRVYKIVGPGNAYVAEAKRQVYGQVSIDMIAGPSEILIIADGSADPRFIAADLLSQAEHDKNACAMLVTDSENLARAAAEETERQLNALSRGDIARASIENNGRIYIVKDMEEAAEAANLLAPEHLELCVKDPFSMLDKVKNAGSVFLGNYCPEALGDYMAGPNHTLPTSGTARFSSPLSVDDFIKKSQYVYYPKEAFGRVYKDVAGFAAAEGLTAHAKSAEIRFEEKL